MQIIVEFPAVDGIPTAFANKPMNYYVLQNWTLMATMVWFLIIFVDTNENYPRTVNLNIVQLTQSIPYVVWFSD